MDQIFSVATLATALRMSTPLILAGLGGMVSLQTGELNIALEGMMLMGSFFAIIGSYFFQNAWMGLLCAVLASTLFACIFAFFVIHLHSDVFVVGIALNLLATGATVFLLRLIFQVKGSFGSPQIAPLPTLTFPWLAKIPFLGDLLNGHSLFVYLAWVFVAVFWLLIYRTPFGFYLRAAGEKPKALETAGISVNRVRWWASILCGVMCGMAGAHLSLGYLVQFAENMTAGRGFIAIAAVIFGGTNPIGMSLTALLFGFADGLSLRIQNLGIPAQITLMLPYITTLAALFIRSVSQQRKGHLVPAR